MQKPKPLYNSNQPKFNSGIERTTNDHHSYSGVTLLSNLIIVLQDKTGKINDRYDLETKSQDLYKMRERDLLERLTNNNTLLTLNEVIEIFYMLQPPTDIRGAGLRYNL